MSKKSRVDVVQSRKGTGLKWSLLLRKHSISVNGSHCKRIPFREVGLMWIEGKVEIHKIEYRNKGAFYSLSFVSSFLTLTLVSQLSIMSLVCPTIPSVGFVGTAVIHVVPATSGAGCTTSSQGVPLGTTFSQGVPLGCQPPPGYTRFN